MGAIDPEFIAETQQFWGRRLGREVTAGEAEEAIQAVSQFFDLLAEWDRDGLTPDQLSDDQSN